MNVSKKMTVGTVGVALTFLQQALETPWQQQMPMAIVIGAYLIAQGLSDHGKEASKLGIQAVGELIPGSIEEFSAPVVKIEGCGVDVDGPIRIEGTEESPVTITGAVEFHPK